MKQFPSAILWGTLFVLLASGCATTPKPQAAAPKISLPPMQKALADYKAIQARGGWPVIPGGERLQKGDSGERVALLRKRLAATGDLAKAKDSDVFDDDVELAVSRFQERHGLEPDGAVGKETLAALNVSIEDRIRQLHVNLARRDELAKKIDGNRSVVVNIPDFRLKVIENNRSVMGMKVVVGQRREWQTPLLSSEIRYLILNPKWNVPSGIFEKELIHHLRKDPTYLERHGMKVISTVANAGDVDPATVDWDQVNAKNPQLRIVQHEGAGNSLGRIKFMFPNPYDVYLHDTPEKKFFVRNMRALSHGCIRVEKPLDLAEYLMRDDPNWTRERIQSSINSGKNRDIPLPSAVPVHVIYITAWVDEFGIVQFRDDIYGRDAGEAPEVAPAGAAY